MGIRIQNEGVEQRINHVSEVREHELGAIRGIITVHHSDGVSGCTIFNDGTKAWWSEGHLNWIAILRPDGVWEEASARDLIDHGVAHPIWTLLSGDDIEAALGPQQRRMNECEEREHRMARNWAYEFNSDWRTK